MSHTLVTIPFSHFCEKARWSLDAAGIAYPEEGPEVTAVRETPSGQFALRVYRDHRRTDG